MVRLGIRLTVGAPLSTPGLLLLAACSTSAAGEQSCNARCSSEDPAIDVGVWDGDALEELEGGQPMVYGPQGGQHFFVDATINVPLTGRLRIDLNFEDPAGERVGAGRWQEDLQECGQLMEDIPIVVVTDERTEGRLRFEAAVDDCEWSGDLGMVVALPPLGAEEAAVADAGAELDESRTSTLQDAGQATGRDAATAELPRVEDGG